MNSSENKPHIALVTTWFPPMQSVATNRMLAFTEYLSEDYNVSVFALDDHHHTANWNVNTTVYYVKSTSLFDKIRSNPKDSKWKHCFKTALRVVLSKCLKNPLAGWQKGVTHKLTEVHQQTPFDLIISSFAPQETHLAVIDFKMKNQSVKWIADMRDEMSKNPGVDPKSKMHLEAVEALVNRYADAITSVSKPILDDFKILCPKVSFFEEVRNGFNHNLTFNDPTGKRNSLKIGYFGSFYGIIKPTHLFEALIRIHDDFDFEFHIYGAHANFNIPPLLAKQVILHPGLPYEEAIRKMNEMDLNVVIYPTNGRKGVYTGKLFDYISARRPILALMDTSDVASQLINEFNCGYVCDNNYVDSIVTCLREIQTDLKLGNWKVSSQESIQLVHRKQGVGKLKQLIQKLLQ